MEVSDRRNSGAEYIDIELYGSNGPRGNEIKRTVYKKPVVKYFLR